MSTESIRPISDGTYLELTPKSGGDHYVEVDEAVADDWTSHVSRAWDTYKVDTYNYPDLSQASGTIDSVTVYTRTYADGAGMLEKAAIYTNSTLYYGTEASIPNGSWGSYSHTFTTNPDTSSAWTVAEINASEFGVALQALQGSEATCTQVYVVVDYTSGVSIPVAMHHYRNLREG